MCSSLWLARAVWRMWLWGCWPESLDTVLTGTSSWLTVDGLDSGTFINIIDTIYNLQNWFSWLPFLSCHNHYLLIQDNQRNSFVSPWLSVAPTFASNPFFCSQSRRSWQTSHRICHDWRPPRPQVMPSILVSSLNTKVKLALSSDEGYFPPGCCLWLRSTAEWSLFQDRWTTANTPWALCSHWSPTMLVLFYKERSLTLCQF